MISCKLVLVENHYNGPILIKCVLFHLILQWTSLLLLTIDRSKTQKWKKSGFFFCFFVCFSITSCGWSTVWHIASFHAWQKSVQEAYHYYCQIGTAVYSSIMQSSLILSLTITCFTLALRLTLIYSTTLAAAERKRKKEKYPVSICCAKQSFANIVFLL